MARSWSRRSSLGLAIITILLPMTLSTTECGVYLAPSTIPGAGLGMFAGKNYTTWEPIGPADVIIPVADYGTEGHNIGRGSLILDFYGWNAPSYVLDRACFLQCVGKTALTLSF